MHVLEEKLAHVKNNPLREFKWQSNEFKQEINKITAPSFDGKQLWTTYNKQFEAAASAVSWNETGSVTNLILALRGEIFFIRTPVCGDFIALK